MADHTATLLVEHDVAVAMERECRFLLTGATMKSGTVLFDREARFDDGMRMAVQVISAPNQTAWSQGVLFDAHGNECACTEVGEAFLGEYCVSVDGEAYIVNVETEREE